jgi:hypothetical protein
VLTQTAITLLLGRLREDSFRKEREIKRSQKRKIVSSLHVFVEVELLPVSLPHRVCFVSDIGSVFIKKHRTFRKIFIFGL